MNKNQKYDIDSSDIFVQGEIKFDEKYRDQTKNIFGDYGFSDPHLKIINNYIDNQAKLGYSLKGLASKYDLYLPSLMSARMGISDLINQDRLKAIIDQFGFPNRQLVGKDAMQGVWAIIQHADIDVEWQKFQLPKIKVEVEKGEYSKHKYTYLYDRIQVNSGLPQRYGTQFGTVDRKKGIAKLRETEDIDKLNERRREMEMMPIEVYRRLILEPR